MPGTSLSTAELRRYPRHLNLPQGGVEGQQKLKDASVLLVGAGGLGSPAALYLAAAGVGRLGIVDFDTVDESNLHRQILHGTSDVGRSKLASAIDSIREMIGSDGTLLRPRSGLPDRRVPRIGTGGLHHGCGGPRQRWAVDVSAP